jgi:hypothetical protein
MVSLTPTCTLSAADQVVITAITLSLMYMGDIMVISASICVLLYSLVVIFTIIRNNLDIPYLLLIRLRFIIYMWLLLGFHYLPQSIIYLI